MTTTMKRRPRYSDNKINVMNSKERMDFSRDLFNSRYKYSNNMTEVGFEGLAKRLYDREIGYKQFKEGVGQLETENTDWFDLLTEDSFSHQHTLSLTGGTKDLRYYSSVGYARDNDVIKGNRNERYTVVLNMDANLTKYLAASFSIKGNVGEREGIINPRWLRWIMLITRVGRYLLMQGTAVTSFMVNTTGWFRINLIY